MAVIRNLVVKIGADISGLSKGLMQAQRHLTKLSKSITKIGVSLTAKITTPLIGLATLSVKAASQLESSMENVAKSFSGAGDQVDNLTESAKKMAKATSRSVTDVANTMNVLRKAGYSLAETEKSLVTITNLATGSNSDLAATATNVTKVLSVFNLGADETNRVANVMAGTLDKSTYSLDELTLALGLVGNTASQVGFSIEETSAGLAILSQRGYKAEAAGSALKAIFQKLSAPTSEMKKTLDKLGLSMADIDPATNSLAQIIGKFTEAGITSSDAVALFGNQLEGAFMSLVTESATNIEALTETLTDSNAAEESAAKQLNTLAGTLKVVKAQLSEISLQLGEVLLPIVKDFLQNAIIPLIEKFTALSDRTKKIIVIVAGVAAAIGPVILAVGKIIKVVATVVKLLGAVSSPVLAIIAAIAAVIAIMVTLYNTNEEFRDKVNEIWGKIQEIIGAAITFISQMWEQYGSQLLSSVAKVFTTILDIISGVVSAIIDMISYVWNSLVELWNNNEQFRTVITTIWNGISEAISTAINFIVDTWNEYGAQFLASAVAIFQKVWDVVVEVFAGIIASVTNFLGYLEPIWEQVKKLFMTLWDVLCELYELLKPVFEVIGGLVLGLLATTNGVINGVINALGPLIQAILNVLQIIVDVVGAIVKVFKGDFSGAFDHLKNVATNFKDFFINTWQGIKNFFAGFVGGFVSLFETMGINIVNVFKNMWNGITNFFSNFTSGVKSFGNNVWNGITGTFGNIGTWFSNLGSNAFNWGKNLVNMIGNGINSAWESVKNGCNKVIGTIKGWLGFGSPTKEGPGRYSDEWAPNFMRMYSEGFEDNIPELKSALNEVAETVADYGTPTDTVIGTGDTNIGADLTNAMLSAMSVMNNNNPQDSQQINLNIDGTTFARLIYPRLTKEFQRNGINLSEGGF